MVANGLMIHQSLKNKPKTATKKKASLKAQRKTATWISECNAGNRLSDYC